MAAYKPTVLRNDSPDNMARFFGRILSPITKPSPIVCDNRIGDIATVDDVDFLPDGTVRYVGAGRQTFAAMVSFKTSPDYLDEDFFNSISTIQTEMICMNGFSIMDASGIESVLRQRRATADEKNKSSTEQISAAESAMDENISGNQNLVGYYPLFIIFGATPDALKNT